MPEFMYNSNKLEFLKHFLYILKLSNGHSMFNPQTCQLLA